MSLAKAEEELQNHNGTCPVCLRTTWVENERTNWLSNGKIQLRIMSEAGDVHH